MECRTKRASTRRGGNSEAGVSTKSYCIILCYTITYFNTILYSYMTYYMLYACASTRRGGESEAGVSDSPSSKSAASREGLQSPERGPVATYCYY